MGHPTDRPLDVGYSSSTVAHLGGEGSWVMGHPTDRPLDVGRGSSTSITVSTINTEHYKQRLKCHYQLTPNISTGGEREGRI